MPIRQQPKTFGQALQQFNGGRGVKTEPATVVAVMSNTAIVRTASGSTLPAQIGPGGVAAGQAVTLQDDRGRLSVVASGGTGTGAGALFTGGSAVTYSGAPSTASYLTLGSDATLTSERVFTKGSGLAATDGGAGSTYTLAVGAGTGITVNTNDVAVNQGYAFTWTAAHTFSNGLYFGADVLLTRIAADVLALGTGDSFRSQSYTSGVNGWQIDAGGTAEFENVRIRGELAASVFKVSEMSATAGTLGVWYSAAAVYADFTTPGSISGTGSMQAKNSDAAGMLFGVNDYVQIKTWTGAAVSNAWLRIDSRTNNTTYTTYGYTLMSGSTSATFRAGTAVADWGPSGSGAITLSADGTIGSSANLSILTHAGSPWSATTLVTRLGNLNGSYGVVSNYYGIGLGDYSGGNYLKYDTNGGFLMRAGSGSVGIGASGLRLQYSTSSWSGVGTAGSDIMWNADPTLNTSPLASISANKYSGGPSSTVLGLAVSDTGARSVQVNLQATHVTHGTVALNLYRDSTLNYAELTGGSLNVSGNGVNVGAAAGATSGQVRTEELYLGSSSDVRLYRSAADTLRTPDTLIVDGNGTVSGGLSLGTAPGAPTGAIYTSAEIGIGGTAETNARLDVQTGTTARYVKIGTNAYSFRIGELQSGNQFIGVGVKKTAADSTYRSESNNNSAVRHSALEFSYDGDLEYKYASYQADDTALTMTSRLYMVGSSGWLGIGTTAPQARLHTYDTDGGTLHNFRTTGIAGTRVTIVPNGTGDCVQSCSVFGTAYDSSGNAWELRGSLESGVSAGAEQSVQVAGDGTDNLHVIVKTDGQVEIVRNAGARTWSVCLSAWWR